MLDELAPNDVDPESLEADEIVKTDGMLRECWNVSLELLVGSTLRCFSGILEAFRNSVRGMRMLVPAPPHPGPPSKMAALALLLNCGGVHQSKRNRGLMGSSVQTPLCLYVLEKGLRHFGCVTQAVETAYRKNNVRPQ